MADEPEKPKTSLVREASAFVFAGIVVTAIFATAFFSCGVLVRVFRSGAGL